MKLKWRTLTAAVLGPLLALSAITTTFSGAAQAASFRERSYQDPLIVLEKQGLVGPATAAAKKAADARSKAAKDAAPSGGASPLQPVSLMALVPEGRKAAQDGVVHRAAGNKYGVVTGTGQQGLNAGYIAINDSSAPTEYKFAVGDASTRLDLNADGSIMVYDATGQQVNYIQQAWATDASGRSVPTRYAVSGNVITQTVGHFGAQYPVTADPQTACGFGWCSIYFNRSETKDIATAGLTALGGAAVACAIGGPIAAAACGVAAASIGATAQYADNRGQCVGLSFWGIYPAIGWNPFPYTGPQCR
jgi:hypothetical protein